MAPQDCLPPPPLPLRPVTTMLQTIIATLFALLTFVLPLVEAASSKNNAKSAAKLAGGVLAGIIVGIVVFFGKCSPVTSGTFLINILSHYCCYYFLLCQKETSSEKQGTRTNLNNGRQRPKHTKYCPIMIHKYPVIAPPLILGQKRIRSFHGHLRIWPYSNVIDHSMNVLHPYGLFSRYLCHYGP